ncbi:hypothetical protein FIE12Z_7368 [Fusarium flagelliforme]|uniref:Azaphilone pigments biosynthesis cluster protein L N-terminal domain-containing protein n=1 Tax=Fusarium flagelliforme TaxID=2675880 RepID=A0A395MMJ2_9HYPO|nr:hypothetical protein FIE12Z_7368 [Fusarium flagelliforme]
MEAIGAGASTLAFVLLALKSAKIINESLSSIKDAPRTVIELLEDIKFLQSVLERLSQCTLQHASISTVDSLTQTLQGCTTELSRIEGRLAKFLQDTAQSMSELSSKADAQATAATSILEEILSEVSRLHARINQDPASGTEEHSDHADDAIVNNLEALQLCSELDSSISRLSTLVDHDGLSLDAEDAEQIIDDLRRFVIVAREKSAANSKPENSNAYSIGADSNTKLEGKASLRDHDEQGMPLLHYAATASVEMCKFLIQSGADVDEMGENTGTALSRIAGLDRHDTTLLLLENMADPTLSYPGWDNPLYTACNLDIPSAELFLRHGRHFTLHDLESYDLNGRTRLHQICMAETKSTSKKKALEMLTVAGANLSARIIKSWSPDDHQTLGFTCLHSLVYKAHRSRDIDELEALVFLIRHGADVFSVDHHQHSVSMRAYLPNDNDNQYSSKGSYRGDLWDAALSICGYDVSEHRAIYPRVSRYNKSYRRKDFERLWQGHESSCPYWDDERYPKVGGDENFWKQPIRRCDHISCSDCEDPQAETFDLEKENGLEANVPGYALDMYRRWTLEASEPEIDAFDRLRSRESPISVDYELYDLISQPERDYNEIPEAYYIWEREQEELEQQEQTPEASEDGEEAFKRLVVEPMMNDLGEQMERDMAEGPGENEEHCMFVDQWLDYYIRAAEEEEEEDME